MATETGIGQGTPGSDQGSGTGIMPAGVLVRIGLVTGKDDIAADPGDLPALLEGFPSSVPQRLDTCLSQVQSLEGYADAELHIGGQTVKALSICNF